MILDSLLQLNSAQSMAGTTSGSSVAFTNIIPLSQIRNIGDGCELVLHIHVTTAFTGAIAGQFQLFSCQTTGIVLATDQVVAEGQYLAADLALNSHIFIPIQGGPAKPNAGGGPSQSPGLYLIGQYTSIAATTTAGAFSSWVGVNKSLPGKYPPKSFTIV